MPASKISITGGSKFDGTAIEMAAEITRLAEEQKVVRANLFTQFTSKIFDEFPGLNRVVVRGFTPGFNDGDPCLHSQEVYVTVGNFSEIEDDSIFRYIDRDSNPSLHWNERHVLKDGVDGYMYNTDLSGAEFQSVREAFNAFADVVSDLYETNYTLTWTRNREDGEIRFSHEYYDCGY